MRSLKAKNDYSREELLELTVARFIDVVYQPDEGELTPHEKGMRTRVKHFLFDRGVDILLVHDLLRYSTIGLKVRKRQRKNRLGFGHIAWNLFREKSQAVNIDLPEW